MDRQDPCGTLAKMSFGMENLSPQTEKDLYFEKDLMNAMSWSGVSNFKI